MATEGGYATEVSDETEARERELVGRHAADADVVITTAQVPGGKAPTLVTREMERRLLEDAGFRVSAAADADEGLNYLGEEEFDCVVTDIEMPGMDGYELTRHLREIPRFSQLPIIVVSTRDRPEDRLEGLQAGADAYLTKQGLDAGELVDLVRRLSGGR